ncbi:MAG: tripartite tricarboxylate transporter substrate binding protein [Betaproteobacteria bacterium]|nr:tripartite tricarboxylate transporter substrate binding protein [Betaproteobacteria bacterium]
MSAIVRSSAALLALVLPLAAASAQTAGWKPEKNVEIVVGSNPGTGTDKTARMIQRLWQEHRMIEATSSVMNKAGGGGAVSWAYLNQHAADPHYLLVTSYNIVTNHITGKSALTYTDFTPIALLISEYIAYSVKADSPIRTTAELIGRLKQDTKSIAVGISSSAGGANHIALGLAMKAAGVEINKMKVVVFNSGAESLTALLGGHVDLVVASGSAILGQLRAGAIRVLAIAAPQRLSGPFGLVPTWKELGLQVVADNWRIVLAPKGLNAAQTAYWDNGFRRLAKTGEWNRELETNYLSNNYLNGADTRKYLDQQYGEVKAMLTELGLARAAPSR